MMGSGRDFLAEVELVETFVMIMMGDGMFSPEGLWKGRVDGEVISGDGFVFLGRLIKILSSR